MPEHAVLTMLVAIATVLLVGRGTAELARRANQPEVLGELLGGFLLGPSVFGAAFPSVERWIFSGPSTQASLQTLSWIGALLLLLIAGMEADLGILKQKLRPGLLSAGFVILPSLLAGTLFSWLVLGTTAPGGIYLGIVLSVTAVSVAAKLLMETDALRRNYAQVILAAGIASEVIVWLFVSIAASIGHGNPLLSGLRTASFAIAFFAMMFLLAQPFTFWAMRRIADLAYVVEGQLTLIVVLTCISAAITQMLGLHALLGAFAFGVILSRAPRVSLDLKQRVQTLTVSLFAPCFFVLAGMRADIFKLGSLSVAGTVLVLFLVATVLKVSLGWLGARLGGLSSREAIIVGLGVNLKGGTDVIVAILGTELGLLTAQAYTMYTVVAILTVMMTPPLMAFFQSKVAPNKEEQERLDTDEAKRRAYLSEVERVLAPIEPKLLPSLPAIVLESIANGKHDQKEVFDITQLVVDGNGTPEPPEESPEVVEAKERLVEANELTTVELTEKVVQTPDPLEEIVEASQGFKLLAIGAGRPPRDSQLTFGQLQDQIIQRVPSDVLVVIRDQGQLERGVKRILVPVNGLEYSIAAADVAAYIAKAYNAELVLFNVMQPGVDSLFWREAANPELLETGYRMLHEVAFRVQRLGIRTRERVRLNEDPAEAIISELHLHKYHLLVMGAAGKGTGKLFLGRRLEQVIHDTKLPVVLLVQHRAVAA